MTIIDTSIGHTCKNFHRKSFFNQFSLQDSTKSYQKNYLISKCFNLKSMPQVFLDVETTQNSFCLKLHICLRFYNSHTYYSDYLLYINWGGLSPTQLKYAQNTLETSIKEIGPFFIADGVRSSNNIEPWWYHVPTARRPDYSKILDVSLN